MGTPSTENRTKTDRDRGTFLRLAWGTYTCFVSAMLAVGLLQAAGLRGDLRAVFCIPAVFFWLTLSSQTVARALRGPPPRP